MRESVRSVKPTEKAGQTRNQAGTSYRNQTDLLLFYEFGVRIQYTVYLGIYHPDRTALLVKNPQN